MSRHSAAYAKKAAGHAAECKRQAAIARIAEPLLEWLQPGDHELSIEEYRAVAQYLFCGEEDSPLLIKALLANEFSLTGFRFWCDPARDAAQRTTLREFCRRTGASHTTLLRHVDQLKLHHRQVGNKKLYVIQDLEHVWSGIKRNG